MFITIVRFNAQLPEAEQGQRIVLAFTPAELQAVLDGEAFAHANRDVFPGFPDKIEVMIMLETPELVARVNKDIEIQTPGDSIAKDSLSTPTKPDLPDITTVVPFGRRPS